MLNWFIRRKLDAFERSFGYDMSYARAILEADRSALVALARVTAMGAYKGDLPAPAAYAAKIAATVAEDCGPCTQLVTTMALREGVAPETVAAILRGDTSAMPEDAELGYRFARAVLARHAEADDLRDEALRRWGPRAPIALAFAVVMGRFYPTLKYALGHAKACTRVEVAGRTIDVLRPSEAHA